MRISRSITFSQMIHDVQRMLTIDPFKFHIKLLTKYSYNMMASYIEKHVHITDDDILQFMLDLATLGCLYLYVETLLVDDDVANDDDPQSFIPIITQGFRTMVVDDEAGSSTYHGDRHGSSTLSGSNMEHAWGSNTTRLDDIIPGDWDHYVTSATEEDVVWGSTVATGSVFQEYHGEYSMYATNVQEPDDLFGDSAQNITSSEHSSEVLGPKDQILIK
ncbi:hypothetical protein F511_21369 [Dorcoceras hygrometricum]|uniref:Uncharacterized protein n=1 Tax=Dorcoceras hygrometricum TaxID=472368 RepID=A0A2Z7BLQ6_9LAMI|nr:hypothetical protein F511_21369 [Dorcoceras hygrometricum]